MTPEEQAAEDERARAAALASMASIGNLPGQTRDALAPATGGQGFDSEGMGPISIEPSSEPDPLSTDTTRDHLGNPDTSSGSAFGPDDPSEAFSGALPQDPNAETYGMATDQDATYPGSMREPGASALASPVIPTSPTTSPAVTGSTPQGARMDPATAVPDRASALASPVTRPGATGGRPPVDAAREAAAGPLPGIDQGLPSEADISGARGGDIGRRILSALGNGLRAGGGMGAIPFQSQAEPLEAERRAGIREALQRKGVMRGQEQTQAASSDRQAVQARLAERQAAQRDRGLDLQEQALPSRIAATEALTEQRGASTEHTRMSTEDLRAEALYRASSREDLESNTSGAADAERAAIAARLALMGAPARDAATAAIQAEGDLSAMNANDLHRIREGLTAGVGLRGAGRGAGDGGARADAQIAEMVSRLGMTDEQARQHRTAVGSDAVARELAGTQSLIAREGGSAQRARAPLAEGEQGPELLQGLHAGVALEPGEARAARTAFRAAADSMAAIGGLEQIGSEFGWRGSFTPEAIQRARPRLMQMRHMAALIQGTGVINPTEVPVIDAAIADPTSLSQVSFQTFSAALAEWRQIMHENLRNAFGDTGFAVQEGVDAALQRFERAGHGGAGDSPSRAPRATAAPTPSAPAEDFSTMSDEDLRALAEGP